MAGPDSHEAKCLRAARAHRCLSPTHTYCTAAPASEMRCRPRGVAARAAMDDWTRSDNRRMLHAVYRVGDMDATIKYYKDHFGMEQLRYRDMPEEKFTNAFMGFGPEDKNFAVELTYNYGQTEYNIGSGFGHFAVATTDVYKMADSIKSAGGTVCPPHLVQTLLALSVRVVAGGEQLHTVHFLLNAIVPALPHQRGSKSLHQCAWSWQCAPGPRMSALCSADHARRRAGQRRHTQHSLCARSHRLQVRAHRAREAGQGAVCTGHAARH